MSEAVSWALTLMQKKWPLTFCKFELQNVPDTMDINDVFGEIKSKVSATLGRSIPDLWDPGKALDEVEQMCQREQS